MEKILVTGAAGFIGSNLCDALLAKGYAICAVDNLSQSTTRNIERHLGSPGFEFVQEDVRNEEAIRRLAQDAGIIVHLAAFKIPRYGNALDTLTINVHGTESVLKAALKDEFETSARRDIVLVLSVGGDRCQTARPSLHHVLPPQPAFFREIR